MWQNTSIVKQGVQSEGHRKRVRANKAIFTQATLICVFNVVASLEYVYMNFFPATPTLVEIGHLCWQLSHGAPPYIYLLLNKTEQERCRLEINNSKTLHVQKVKEITGNSTRQDQHHHCHTDRHFQSPSTFQSSICYVNHPREAVSDYESIPNLPIFV
ncbi:hypothetical protein PENTCL1PPCAC_16444 [Pristionchus entomophagus]|uniref:G protein-coupled receptor n=1 Tax=Pristionchus entomophagus TaxID=358040 RepID=A0AAV5TJT5_9BILA|nr:hypothetical protein PENTCL1PPCAC_16444 [Pristionchus entomophagus]